MYGPWSAAPAALPMSPSVPVPPFTPFDDPPATPLPLKSFSFVIALDKSTAGTVVGMLTGGGTTLNPWAGAGGTSLGSWIFGVCTLGFGVSFGGGGSSFFGGGGGSGLFTSAKRTFSGFTFSGPREPARAVAKTARKTIKECNIMLKMVPP